MRSGRDDCKTRRRDGKEKEEEKEAASNIKSNNPHLAGGESQLKSSHPSLKPSPMDFPMDFP